MALLPEFPRLLLREKSHSWNLLGVAATPGVTMDSTATYIRSDGGGFWACVMNDINLSGPRGRDRERQRLATLLWRAIRQIADGGVNRIVVPRNDALFVPHPIGMARVLNVTHSDTTPFGDGAYYIQPMIDIVSAAAAALRATEMMIQINVAAELIGGESFSVLHPVAGWRLYEIATVDYSDDSHATIAFNPPLREAVTAAYPIEFDRPRCTMRLTQPGAMDLTVHPWTFNVASVDFLEAPVD